MKTTAISLSVAFLILLTGTRAVSFGTALFVSGQRARNVNKPLPAAQSNLNSIPRPVVFREVPGRGLLVTSWINSAGPFTFAIDTGAGATILSPRVADEAKVSLKTGRGSSIAGLSGVLVAAREGFLQSLAIGTPDNYLPARGEVIVTSGLPRDLDGLLDPNDAFGTLGYVIDLPRRELSAFDPHKLPLRMSVQPDEGTVVPWLREGNSHRPFVMLDTGERALIDTGSSLGLAVRDFAGGDGRARGAAVRDVGGSVSARRVAPRTIVIGSLTLRNIPTDMVTGTAVDAPVLLGLSALHPFRLRFDPVHRLIEIAPNENTRFR